jgi:methionine synthase II (cobalamin-independent)
MVEPFRANGYATFIGSLPLRDHREALDLIMEYTPEIPLWTQLTTYPAESMMVQFAPGLPGFCFENSKAYVDTACATFDDELLQFFGDYVAVVEEKLDLESSRFALREDTAKGFFMLVQHLRTLADPPVAVKGQITGPFTFSTGLLDQNKRPIFYDHQLRDAAVKILAMKAKWQVRQLAAFRRPVIIFFDEPALAGVGSAEFTSISNDAIRQCFDEVVEAVHQEGGLAGIHVCANTDWSLVLESSFDIVSFDAYDYFDKFFLYPRQIKNFLESEKVLAWGIVPTSKVDDIEKETAASLLGLWQEHAAQFEVLGIGMGKLIRQSLITPSCGTGSLSVDHAKKVLKLTRAVSMGIRNWGLVDR